MKTKLIFALFVAMLFAFNGCGTDGEPGPQGSQGEQGQAGEKGDKGDKGDTGTANVIYSDWFFPNWNDINTARSKRMIVSNSNFASAYSNGVVLFYWTTNNGSTFLLPWNNISGTTGSLLISRDFNIRGASGNVWITIRKYGSDFTATETDGQVGTTTHNRIRYVIIPGGVLSNGRQETPAVDFSDYEAVKEYYNIPD